MLAISWKSMAITSQWASIVLQIDKPTIDNQQSTTFLICPFFLSDNLKAFKPFHQTPNKNEEKYRRSNNSTNKLWTKKSQDSLVFLQFSIEIGEKNRKQTFTKPNITSICDYSKIRQTKDLRKGREARRIRRAGIKTEIKWTLIQ